ncbi:hypothetical protein [Marinospirillum celere]|uniref:hypothetical protein n=1 Tax=Marinospirillum celere TaxID=1122252 RepID=UPI001160C447|nr:hypothetical protein [Marinospirillum celere]
MSSLVKTKSIPLTTVLLLVLLASSGCTGKISQPDSLENPVFILLLDFGTHSSLLLPRATPGGYVRYSYGDWSWYVEGRDQGYRALPVLFWPTASGLGRVEV